MSISYSALPQIVVPSVKSSSNELTNGTFDSNNTSSSSVDSLLAPQRDDDLEFRIQQRLEASRQGMLQLEALRTKHQKLMQLDLYSGQPIFQIKLNDLRCDSPVSCCVSHRSSISMDSGCVSLSSDFSNQSPMSCNTCRKFSLDDQRKKTEQNVAIENDENQQLVAMAIKSTTAQCCHGRKCCTNGRKPKSTCFSYPDENTIVVDSLSFSQITPPPIHRKFFTTRRSDSVQAHRPCLATSCIDIRSPISLQKQQQAPTHLPVNQSPMLHAKPISISLSSKIPTSPYMRLRDAQKSLKNSRVIQNGDNQSIFRASRIFVDHSSRIVQCPKHIERYDSDEESPRLLRAQPAVLPSSVICRQQSYAHSNESSPCQLRKVHLTENSNSLSNGVVLECHQQLNRCESSQSSETIVPDRTRRRKKEKDWKESEDL
uniref:Uncharacterized protein n=1 Tax=Onchocerca volvulus TaxID=6282 RepID=A0A8R1U253_ONCVO